MQTIVLFRSLFLTFMLSGAHGTLWAQVELSTDLAPTPFWVAPAGCAMAHCDPQMSDLVNMLPPPGPSVILRAHDTLSVGSGIGLGCSSNGVTAVCSYKSASGDAVVAYGPGGKRLWTSGTALGASAYMSAPMIDAQGSVITADKSHVVRFSARGKPVWFVPSAGGYPISPVQTSNGAIFLATAGGPVSAYDSLSGAQLGSLYLYQAGQGGSYFDTVNTPCVAGNRAYVLAQLTATTSVTGRLYAIDIDASNAAQPLSIAWYWEFGGPSGASPSCTGGAVVFDGASLHPGGPLSPTLFALRDDGSHATLLWSQSVVNSVPASVAHDPRGGVWVISAGYPRVERRSESTGLLIDSISVPALLNDGTNYIPSSALTLAGTATRPVLITGAIQTDGLRAKVIAIDLASRSLLWSYDLTPATGTENTAGQFPIITDPNGHPVVVFTGRTTGAYFISQ
ncbi:MAG: PQQ-binding-like beta-propeller repeat protein [Bryobacteraceae bacterium]